MMGFPRLCKSVTGDWIGENGDFTMEDGDLMEHVMGIDKVIM